MICNILPNHEFSAKHSVCKRYYIQELPLLYVYIIKVFNYIQVYPTSIKLYKCRNAIKKQVVLGNEGGDLYHTVEMIILAEECMGIKSDLSEIDQILF